MYNIERILNCYDKENDVENDLEILVDYAMKYIKRRMIIFIITDIDGMVSLSEQTLKKISLKHDVMIVNISDALMTGINAFDIEQENYIPEYLLEDERLKKAEIEVKNQVYESVKEKLKKYNIMTTTINKQEDIVKDVYKLLERRKNANYY